MEQIFWFIRRSIVTRLSSRTQAKREFRSLERSNEVTFPCLLKIKICITFNFSNFFFFNLQNNFVVTGFRALIPESDPLVKVSRQDLHSVDGHQIVTAGTGKFGGNALIIIKILLLQHHNESVYSISTVTSFTVFLLLLLTFFIRKIKSHYTRN